MSSAEAIHHLQWNNMKSSATIEVPYHSQAGHVTMIMYTFNGIIEFHSQRAEISDMYSFSRRLQSKFLIPFDKSHKRESDEIKTPCPQLRLTVTGNY